MVFSDFPFNECAGGKSLKNSDFVDRCVRPPAPINLFRSHLVRSSVRVKLYFPSNESFFFVVQSCTMGQLHPQDYGMLVQYPDAGEDSSFVCQLSPGYHQRSEIRESGEVWVSRTVGKPNKWLGGRETPHTNSLSIFPVTHFDEQW